MGNLHNLLLESVVKLREENTPEVLSSCNGIVMELFCHDPAKHIKLGATFGSSTDKFSVVEVQVVDSTPTREVHPQILDEIALYAHNPSHASLAAAIGSMPVLERSGFDAENCFSLSYVSTLGGYHRSMICPGRRDEVDHSITIEMALDRSGYFVPVIFGDIAQRLGFKASECYADPDFVSGGFPVDSVDLAYRWLLDRGYSVRIVLTNSTSSAVMCTVPGKQSPKEVQFCFQASPERELNWYGVAHELGRMEEILRLYDPHVLSINRVAICGVRLGF